MKSNEMNPLERSVLMSALTRDRSVAAALREQIGQLRVRDREQTGVGFFTRFDSDAIASKVRGSTRIGGVFAEIPGLQHGAGFLIIVNDGKITELEGFTYDEPWPERIGAFEVHPSERGDDEFDALSLL